MSSEISVPHPLNEILNLIDQAKGSVNPKARDIFYYTLEVNNADSFIIEPEKATEPLRSYLSELIKTLK